MRRILLPYARSVIEPVVLRAGLVLKIFAPVAATAIGTPECIREQLETVFGPAHFLRRLRFGSATEDSVSAHLRDLYPPWLTNEAPRQISKWAQAAELVAADPADQKLQLTDSGVEWEAALPADLPAPFGVATLHTPPSLDELRQWFPDDGFVLPERELAGLHAAFHISATKRFVILSGLSGTGKTELLCRYAHAYIAQCGLNLSLHCKVVPVLPDWRDQTGLLGYLNSLHERPTYEREPALGLLLRATANPQHPYFLILDEMNIALVERYFAPLLSAMEQPDKKMIHLHGQSAVIDGVPPSISWPGNLFVGGTVNMDETTHSFSDKVLDRAFMFELWSVDLGGFFDTFKDGAEAQAVAAIRSRLLKIHGALEPIRHHFGYRTASEIVRLVAAGQSDSQRAELLDLAVYAKVLPKVRGQDSKEVQQALESLAACLDDSPALPLSRRKVGEMKARLADTGITNF